MQRLEGGEKLVPIRSRRLNRRGNHNDIGKILLGRDCSCFCEGEGSEKGRKTQEGGRERTNGFFTPLGLMCHPAR